MAKFQFEAERINQKNLSIDDNTGEVITDQVLFAMFGFLPRNQLEQTQMILKAKAVRARANLEAEQYISKQD